jgi:hypothetical protein
VAPVPPQVPDVPPVPPNGFASEQERLQHAFWTQQAEAAKNMPPPLPMPELVQLRVSKAAAIAAIPLPPSPLDDLIDRLGGVDSCAEMTGRSGRIVKNKGRRDYAFVKRTNRVSAQQKLGLSMPVTAEDMDRLNITEKKKFMDGRKNVAIISDAASTGISLHTARGTAACEKRRVHYTIELPWAAEKVVQQLGRTHRSNQVSAPVYKMVVTDLGGERRFAAAVAKRMASLGYIYYIIYIYIYTYVCMYVCMYISTRTRNILYILYIYSIYIIYAYMHTYIHIYTYICVYIHIYTYIYVCVCVCLYILNTHTHTNMYI